MKIRSQDIVFFPPMMTRLLCVLALDLVFNVSCVQAAFGPPMPKQRMVMRVLHPRLNGADARFAPESGH
jgi:hypothetical protein